MKSIITLFFLVGIVPFYGVHSSASGIVKIQKPVPKQAHVVVSHKQNQVLAPSDLDPLFQKHFGANWKTAKAIAKCESSLNASAHNDNPKTGDNSFGLFQINLYGKLAKARPSGEWLLSAENNMSYAAKMSNGGKNWRPWSCARKIGA